jgi:predicted Rossmann fold flavoprotein
MSFTEDLLFTHRGLSGPAILQISSYWQPSETLHINLAPNVNLIKDLKIQKENKPNTLVKTALQAHYPKRLINAFTEENILNQPLQECGQQQLEKISQQYTHWLIKPNGTEGYRTAEVTLGGVDCNMLSSKTCEVRNQPGLFFIGEVVDMTGWLGGYNFQWAWASGFVAGRAA